MTTPADMTTRVRDEMYDIYVSYQQLARRVTDLTDEVAANGGAVGIYGVAGANFPPQGDGFDYDAMVAAFQAIVSLIGAPTLTQKQAIIKARRG